MTEEALANLSFDHLRKGDRIQVDIFHPRIAALVRAGYLKIIWKERGDDSVGEDSGSPALLGGGSDSDLVAGDTVTAKAVGDGAGADLSQQGTGVR